jgi:nitroreductase
MDILDAIFQRRSIRSFLEKPVENETIISLLKAAMAAPTAANCQPWEFIVIDDSEALKNIRAQMIFARYNAPLAIVVCGNMKLAFKGPEQVVWVQDCSAAIENMLLAATGMGLGAVWIGVYPTESKITAVKKLCNIPEYVTPLALVYFGYPAEEKAPRTRYNEKRVYWQVYDPHRKHRTKDAPKRGHY